MARELRPAVCPKCGQDFGAKYWNQVYCKVGCTKSAQNARRYARKKAEGGKVSGS